MRRRTLTLCLALPLLAPALAHLGASAGPSSQAPSSRTPASAAVAAAKPAMIANVDPALFKGLRYRLVGPSRGGRVTTVTGVPSQPRTFYMGVASGGVFRTTDGGATWVPITDGKVPLGSIGCDRGGRLEPERHLRRHRLGRRAQQRLDRPRRLQDAPTAARPGRSPASTTRARSAPCASTPPTPTSSGSPRYGDAFKPNAERGVFKTTDGGKTWKKMLFVSNDSVGRDGRRVPARQPRRRLRVDVAPRAQAVDDHQRRRAKAASTRAPTAATTFTQDHDRPAGELIGKGNLAVTAANPNRIYALVEAKPGGGLYRSDDAGQTLGAGERAGLGLDAAAVLLHDARRRSDQRRRRVRRRRGLLQVGRRRQDVHDAAHAARRQPRHLDQPEERQHHGPVERRRRQRLDRRRPHLVDADEPADRRDLRRSGWTTQFPYKLYGAQQDNTTIIISSQANPYVARPTGAPARAARPARSCRTRARPEHRLRLVQGAVQRDEPEDRAGRRTTGSAGSRSTATPASDLIYRIQRVSPMAPSPHDPERALLRVAVPAPHARQGRDVGEDLARPHGDPGVLPGRERRADHARRDRRGVLQHALRDHRVAARDGRHLDRRRTTARSTSRATTARRGRTSRRRTCPPGGRVQCIDASPHRKGSAYYAVYRYLLGDYQPYIYRTDDYGKTWKRLTDGKNGIPADWPTRVVREDPDREGLLYAGTEFGMFVSFDNGGHWQPFQLNLPQRADQRHQGPPQGPGRRDAGPRVLDPRQPHRRSTRSAPSTTAARCHAAQAARRLPHARRARRCSAR